MPIINLEINGDCTGAVTAIGNTQSAVEALSKRTAGVTVEVRGSDAAVSQLNSVSSAAGALSSGVAVPVGVTGLDGARGDLRGFPSDVAAALSPLSSLDVGVGAGASLRPLLGDLSSVGESSGIVAQSLGDMDAVASRLGGQVSDVSSPLRQMSMAMAGGGEGVSMAESAGAGSVAIRSLDVDMASAGKSAKQLSDEAINVNRALNTVGLAQGYDVFEGHSSGLGVPGTGDGPPRGPGGGGGGGGGGGFGGAGGEGGQFDSWGALSQLSGTTMMAALVGVGSAAVTGAVGIGAVVEATKDVPALAYAANGAMVQLSKGIRSTASEATQAGIPALHALGTELRPLGEEIGRVGAQQLGTTMGVASELAQTATSSLERLQPAIGPAIQGLGGLGDAFMKGFSSPEAVSGIKAVSDSLADPKVKEGVADTVEGVVGASTILTKVAADVFGAVNNATGGPEGSTAATGGITGGFLGKSILGDLFGGGFAGGIKGLGVGGALGGLGMGAAALEEQHGMEGAVTPTLLGEGAGTALGGIVGSLAGPVGTAVGMLAGGALGGGIGMATSETAPETTGWGRATNLGGAFLNTAASAISDILNAPSAWESGHGDHAFDRSRAAGDDFVSRLSTATGVSEKDLTATPWAPGGNAPEHAQAASSAGGFPTDRPAGRYGWDADANGNLTPSNKPGSGGGAVPWEGLAARGAPQTGVQGQGPGSSVGASSQGLNQLRSSLTATTPAISQLGQATVNTGSQIQQLGQHATVSTPQIQQLQQQSQTTAQTTQQLAQPLQQLQQQSQTTAQSFTQMAQPIQQLAQPLQQLQQQTSDTMSPIQQLPQTATDQLQQASQSITQGSVDLGSQVPQGMAQGITDGASGACDAAAGLSQSAAACGASAMGTQSPSKVFIGIGESTGQGLAIGVRNSSSLSDDAVTAAMGSAVAAGTSALGGALGAGMVSASNGVEPIASDRGLAVGYHWAQSVVTGANSVLQSSQFTSAGVPDVGSALARTALGQSGLLAAAGAGAAIYNTAAGNAGQVSLGGGSAASTPVVNAEIHVTVSGQPMQVIAQNVVNASFRQVTDSIKRQRG